jgi:predicted outer membrane repeat protein
LVIFTALLMLSFAVSASAADVWYVSTTGLDSNGGTSWSDAVATFQKGIDTAADGDTVLVADGTYSGTGNFNIKLWGKKIIVRSANGPTACVIDCNDQGRAFVLDWGETSDSVIDGFTILDGNTNATYSYGGGMLCQGAAPIIRNCIFKSNTGGQWGGALHVRTSPFSYETKVINCVFIDNSASYGGGAISTYGAAPVFINCTFYGNSAGSFGGAVALGDPDAGTSFVNCIFWNNLPGTFYGDPIVTYSLVPGGYTGLGNIDEDPEHTDPANDDLRLATDSPCIDAANSYASDVPENDLDGKPRFIDGDNDKVVDVDMGAYEYGDVCECDFIGDLDTDGKDLADYINDDDGFTVSVIGADFGRTDCPLYQESL